MEGERGEALRAQLAASHPGQTVEEIDDAIQTACALFLDSAADVSDHGQAYTWVRTVAHRVLSREFERRRRELAVDPSTSLFDAARSESDDPAERVVEREIEADLDELTHRLAAGLSDGQRQVLALYAAGYSRPEIASRLGRTNRAVKRDLLEIMERARAAVARLAGGGCPRGEPLVLRLACRLASPAESAQARLHLTRCSRCEEFHRQLNFWREKAAALLPVPAGDETAPKLAERAVHKAADGVSSVKQHLADGAAQAKQQAGAAYIRATDPTPLAGARPGAALAVVAGCVTIGTGTYCIDNDVNPLRSVGLLPPVVEKEQAERRPDRKPKPKQPASKPTVEAPPAPAPAPEPEPAPEPAPEPEPEPQSISPTPAPPTASDSFSGLSGDPTAEPAPAQPNSTDFGGL